MSNRWIYELRNVLRQAFTVDSNRWIETVKILVQKHGSPSGNLIAQIRDANDRVIAQSEAQPISRVFSGETERYVKAQFDLMANLKSGTTYYMCLTSSGGYSYSDSAYVAWINAADVGYNETTYTPKKGASAPLVFRLYKRARLTRETA